MAPCENAYTFSSPGACTSFRKRTSARQAVHCRPTARRSCSPCEADRREYFLAWPYPVIACRACQARDRQLPKANPQTLVINEGPAGAGQTRCSRGDFRAACARSAKIEIAGWARSRRPLHAAPTSATCGNLTFVLTDAALAANDCSVRVSFVRPGCGERAV